MFKRILCAIFIIAGIYCYFNLYNVQLKEKELKSDYAKVTNVRNGIFNYELWKEKIAQALHQKIDEFELSNENKANIEQEISKILNSLVDELNVYIEELKDPSTFIGLVKTGVIKILEDIIYDENALRAKIPDYANQIVEHIDSDEGKAQLKDLIKDELDKLIGGYMVGWKDPELVEVMEKYQLFESNQVKAELERQLQQNKTKSSFWAIVLFCMALALAVFSFWNLDLINYSFLGAWVLFLLPAVSLPMLSVGAELTAISIDLMGIDLEFGRQTLFYQSQSILDLVKTLFEQPNFSAVLIGFLVMFFSIVFPISKLIIQIIDEFKSSNNRIIKYLINYGGKWSMTDVFVVAIFMAYIGFNTLIDTQLGHIHENMGNKVDLTSANLTQLHFPILFFVGYVILNIVGSPVNKNY